MELRVKVVAVNLDERKIDFELVGMPQAEEERRESGQRARKPRAGAADKRGKRDKKAKGKEKTKGKRKPRRNKQR